MKPSICLFALIGLITLHLTSAVEVVVDPQNGNDNSVSGPYKTLQKALNTYASSIWVKSNGVVDLGNATISATGFSTLRIFSNGTSKAQLRCITPAPVSFWFSGINSLMIENLIFGDCTTSYGGIFCNDINNMQWINSVIENMQVSGAAALTITNSNNVNISGTTIRNNTGFTSGGGIYIEISNVTISNSNVTQNKAENGGGLYYGFSGTTPQNTLSLSISNSEFSYNKANLSGGGLYLSGSNTNFQVSLSQVKILGNVADVKNSNDSQEQGNGAGIAFLDVAAVVQDSIFESNTLTKTVGGAVFAQYSSNTNQIYKFINSEFSSNSAEGGAALCLDNFNQVDIQFPSLIQNCSFHDNVGVSYGAGITTYYFPAKITDTQIFNNNAPSSGGIRIDHSIVEITRTSITQNAYWGIGCFDSNITVEDPSFYANNPTDSNGCGTCTWVSPVFDCSATCTNRDSCSVCGGTNACLGCDDQPYADPCPSPSATPSASPAQENSSPSEKSNTGVIAGVVGGVGGFLILGSAAGVVAVRIRTRNRKYIEEEEMKWRKESESRTPPATGGQVSTNYSVALSQSPSQSQSTPYESIIHELGLPDQPGVTNLYLEDITEEEELGRGSFGVVFKGRYKDQIVAVKKLLDSLNRSQLSTFASEAAIMASIPSHKHVVELIGMVPRPPCIIVKYYPNGSLQKLLRNPETPISKQMIVKIIRGITEGMAHLAQHKVVHRDLAARNILLDENWEAIVSDFGFARALQEDIDSAQTYTTVGPIRWMALESLTSRTYSEKSDVWSWAVTVWECLTRDVPFGSLDNVNVIVSVTAGQRLSIPTRCSPSLASLMASCWEADPNNRPTFENILQVVQTEGENILSE